MELLLGFFKKNAIFLLVITVLGGYLVYTKIKGNSSESMEGKMKTDRKIDQEGGDVAVEDKKEISKRDNITDVSASPGAATVIINEEKSKPEDEFYYFENLVNIDPLIRTCPDNIGSGDKDFGGHGPVTHIDATVEIRNNKEVWVVVNFNAKESKKDYTECGKKVEKSVFTAGVNQEIIEILSSKTSYADYVDNNHDLDYPMVSGGSLVSRFEIMGDTDGNDVGNCTPDDTYFSVHFNGMKIRIKQKK